jgi:hypothetical protein
MAIAAVVKSRLNRRALNTLTTLNTLNALNASNLLMMDMTELLASQ